jgi:glycosyltransferase involved in cell wall biosynthesis
MHTLSNERPRPCYDVVIPARDEAPTVAAVVAAARAAPGAGRVLVVDDASRDETAALARAAGAEVVPSRGHGSKALALATGVEATGAEVLVFFDADIRGVGPRHFEQLAGPVLAGSSAMCCGIVDYGRLRNTLFQRLPPITGLRALRRGVFTAIPGARLNGFQVEIMINEVVARRALPAAMTVLRGTDHRSKVEKLGALRGARAHLAMTLQLLHCLTFVPLWTYGSYLRHLTVLGDAEVDAGLPSTTSGPRLSAVGAQEVRRHDG